MQTVVANNRWFIVLTVVVALMLSVMPLPQEISWLRPQFVAMVFIYWSLALPQTVGILSAWMTGLSLDVVSFSVFGQHTLAMVIVAYICLLSYQRIRTYQPWQQAIWIFVMLGIYQLFVNWVHSLTGHSARPSEFLLPAVASALLWPIVHVLLERFRVIYRVS
ncbi:rod shape-determining protein MreD [Sessilibacter sp. MAH2]